MIIAEEERSDITRMNDFWTIVGRVIRLINSVNQGKVHRKIIECDLLMRGGGFRRQGGFFDSGAASGVPPTTETERITGTS